MHRLLLLYFAVLFVFAGWIAALEFGGDGAALEELSAAGSGHDRAATNASRPESGSYKEEQSAAAGQAEDRLGNAARVEDRPGDNVQADDKSGGASRHRDGDGDAGDVPANSDRPSVTAGQAENRQGDNAQVDDKSGGASRHGDGDGDAGDGPANGDRPSVTAFELPYLELGYKAVADAVRECETRFMQKINLPIYIPPIEFTHQLGKCSINFDKQDQLEINYLNERNPDHRYMILVRPEKHKVDFPVRRIKQVFALTDGTEASLSVTPENGYHVLSFERDTWQYLLVAPMRPEGMLQPEELVKAANSMWRYYPMKVNSRIR